jgi:polar amino acid transport system substrate-binding protein
MSKRFWLTIVILLVALTGLAAQDYKVVVPQLSPMATDTYSKLIQAILDAGSKKATMQIVPFARAIYLIETNAADIESSLIQNPNKSKWAALKYDFATPEAINIVFVLFTNKNKPIKAADLKAGKLSGLKLETDTTLVDYFSVPVSASSNMDASLQKVDSGMIDGYLFSQGSGDPALKRLGLKNVHREYYDTFVGAFLLQKGGRGGPLDKLLMDGMAKIKTNGKYKEIVGPYAATASTYIDWQP